MNQFLGFNHNSDYGCTFHYTSPEQVDGRKDIDGRIDIYSLAATLYYMLTGQTVYSVNSFQELTMKF